MTAVKNDIHAIRSAAVENEAATTAKLTVRDAADAPVGGIDTSKNDAGQASVRPVVADPVQLTRNSMRQFNENFHVMVEVGAVATSGYQSAISEWSKYAQRVTRRNVEILSKARDPRALLGSQDNYLKEGMQNLLSVNAQVSELAAQVAREMIGKLNAGAGKTTDRLPSM